MQILSTRAARADFGGTLRAARDGDVIIVEQSGFPIAKIVALSGRDFEEWRRTRAAERDE